MLAEMTRRLLRVTACTLVLTVIIVSTAGGATGPRAPQPAQRPTVVVEVREGGFHWEDAAIGAAAVFGLVLVGSGAVLAFRRAATPSMREENHA
jgi:hypothetical protein